MRDFSSGTRFWVESGNFGVKIEKISSMKSGETWGNARSTRNQANPWTKSTKHHHTNKSQKNLRLFLVGIFEIKEEHNKIKLENKEGRL